jgi:O-antigen/teichoic acid export membrane protein
MVVRLRNFLDDPIRNRRRRGIPPDRPLMNAGLGPVGYLLNMTGRQGRTIPVLGCTAALNVALTVALVPFYGLAGAAFSSGACLVLWNGWLHRIVVKELGFSPSILGALRR